MSMLSSIKECNCRVYQQHEVFQMANNAVFTSRREDAMFFSHWHSRMQMMSQWYGTDFFLVVEIDEKGNRAGLLADSDYLQFILV